MSGPPSQPSTTTRTYQETRQSLRKGRRSSAQFERGDSTNLCEVVHTWHRPHMGRRKTIIEFSLFRNDDRWFARKIKEKKDETWKEDILAEVIEAFKINRVPAVAFPTDDALKTFSMKRKKPEKEEIVRRTKSRFTVSDI